MRFPLFRQGCTTCRIAKSSTVAAKFKVFELRVAVDRLAMDEAKTSVKMPATARSAILTPKFSCNSPKAPALTEPRHHR